MSDDQPSDLADELRNKLVRDTATIIREETKRAKQLFRFDEEGEIHLTGASDYGLKSRVLVMLIARQYAKYADFTDEATISTAELAESLGAESKTVSARLSELKDEYVESLDHGEYRIPGQAISDVLDELEE